MNAALPQFSGSQILVLVLMSVLFLAGLLLGLLAGRRLGKSSAERDLDGRIGAERLDAVKRSRAVVGGQVAEQLAPFLPDFPVDPGTARFVGRPVDYVCFPGAVPGRVDEIVFVEVKTGSSELSPAERDIRNAISDGRFRWIEYRIPD